MASWDVMKDAAAAAAASSKAVVAGGMIKHSASPFLGVGSSCIGSPGGFFDDGS